MDGQRRELKNAGIYVEEGFIKQIGLNGELPATADVVLPREYIQESRMPTRVGKASRLTPLPRKIKRTLAI
jgi:hypothetical protein